MKAVCIAAGVCGGQGTSGTKMDKYEFNIKAEQLKKQVKAGDYETAQKICDSIDWRRVNNVSLLSMVASVYEHNRDYDEAKEILLLAYEKAPIGKRLLYKLATLALKLGNVAEAEEYYKEFYDLAKGDPRQHILRYLILKAKGAPVTNLISSLEAYNRMELDERWMYELAELYHKAGMSDDCVAMCDRIMLMFGIGQYVNKAIYLKTVMEGRELNDYQKTLVSNRDQYEFYSDYDDQAENGGQAGEDEGVREARRQQDLELEENAVGRQGATGTLPRLTSDRESDNVLYQYDDTDDLPENERTRVLDDINTVLPNTREWNEVEGGRNARERDAAMAAAQRQADEAMEQAKEAAKAAAQARAAARAAVQARESAEAQAAELQAAAAGQGTQGQGTLAQGISAGIQTAAQVAQTMTQSSAQTAAGTADEQQSDADAAGDGVLYTVNFLVERRNDEAGLAAAIELLRRMHANTGSTNQVTKIKAEKLNQRGVANSAPKLEGRDLIVEAAGDLSTQSINELIDLIYEQPDKRVVVLVDNHMQIERLRNRYPELMNLFYVDDDDTAADAAPEASYAQGTAPAQSGYGQAAPAGYAQGTAPAQNAYGQTAPAQGYAPQTGYNQGGYEQSAYSQDAYGHDTYGQDGIYSQNAAQGTYQSMSNMQMQQDGYDAAGAAAIATEQGGAQGQMDIDEFARYCQEYAASIDCAIPGKSLLALYERIEIMEEDGIALTRDAAVDLIEETADKAENPTFGKKLSGMFSPKYDKEGLLILKEENFLP